MRLINIKNYKELQNTAQDRKLPMVTQDKVNMGWNHDKNVIFGSYCRFILGGTTLCLSFHIQDWKVLPQFCTVGGNISVLEVYWLQRVVELDPQSITTPQFYMLLFKPNVRARRFISIKVSWPFSKFTMLESIPHNYPQNQRGNCKKYVESEPTNCMTRIYARWAAQQSLLQTVSFYISLWWHCVGSPRGCLCITADGCHGNRCLHVLPGSPTQAQTPTHP